MAEIACNLAVESDALHPQPFEKLGHDHSTDRIDGVHYHFEACEYEGQDYADDDDAIERLLEGDAARSTVLPLLEKLTPAQRDVIDALFYKGMTAKEYATSKGITAQSVSDIKLAAFKKLKKFWGNA